MKDELNPPVRSNRRDNSVIWAIAALSMAGLGAITLSYPLWHTQRRSLDSSGLNVAGVSSANVELGAPVPGAVPATPFSVRGPTAPLLPSPAPMAEKKSSTGSSLSMVLPLDPGKAVQNHPISSAARNFNEAKIKYESIYSAIQSRHAAQSVVVRQYLQDRNNDPQLVGFINDYNRDHDFTKYLHNFVTSPSFARLAIKYGTQPDMLAYAMDLVTSSPKEVVDSWNHYAAIDNAAAKELTVNLLHAAGLPVSLAQPLISGKMDPKQAASQMMAATPGLSGADIQQLQQQVNRQ